MNLFVILLIGPEEKTLEIMAEEVFYALEEAMKTGACGAKVTHINGEEQRDLEMTFSL